MDPLLAFNNCLQDVLRPEVIIYTFIAWIRDEANRQDVRGAAPDTMEGPTEALNKSQPFSNEERKREIIPGIFWTRLTAASNGMSVSVGNKITYLLKEINLRIIALVGGLPHERMIDFNNRGMGRTGTSS